MKKKYGARYLRNTAGYLLIIMVMLSGCTNNKNENTFDMGTTAGETIYETMDTEDNLETTRATTEQNSQVDPSEDKTIIDEGIPAESDSDVSDVTEGEIPNIPLGEGGLPIL